MTQITTYSAFFNELLVSFYIKKDHYYCSSLCNFLHEQRRDITENEKVFCNAFYVKSFHYFLKNTKPQNIKTAMLYGHFLALSRPMFTLSNCKNVIFILFVPIWKIPTIFLGYEGLDCPVTIFFIKKTHSLPEPSISKSPLVDCWRNLQMTHLIFQNRAKSQKVYNVAGFNLLGTSKFWQERDWNLMFRVEMLPNFCVTFYQLKHHLKSSSKCQYQLGYASAFRTRNISNTLCFEIPSWPTKVGPSLVCYLCLFLQPFSPYMNEIRHFRGSMGVLGTAMSTSS